MLSLFRNDNRSIFSLFVLLTVLVFGLVACEAEEDAETSGDDTGDDTETVGDGDGSTGGSGGEVDTTNIDAFAIRATSENEDYTLYLSKDGDGTTPCEPTDDDRIITCEINVDELNLYFYGVSFTMLAPQNQCAYVSYTPYYFSVAPNAFSTPTRVAYAIDGDGAIVAVNTTFTATGDLTGVGTDADIMYYLGGWISHTDLYGTTATTEDDLRCPWDYSDVGEVEDGENCCRGSYALFKDDNTELTQGDSAEWGGSQSACYRGAGIVDTFEAVDDAGFPGLVYYNVPDEGLAQEYSYTAPVNLELVEEVVHIANYHPATTVAAMPVPLKDGVPYYIAECYNENREVQYKINIQIREWNTEDELELFVAGDSEVGGLEDPPFGSDRNDDYPSWSAIEASTTGFGLADFGFDEANIHPYLTNVDGTNNTTVEYLGFVPNESSPQTPIIIDNP